MIGETDPILTDSTSRDGEKVKYYMIWSFLFPVLSSKEKKWSGYTRGSLGALNVIVTLRAWKNSI